MPPKIIQALKEFHRTPLAADVMLAANGWDIQITYRTVKFVRSPQGGPYTRWDVWTNDEGHVGQVSFNNRARRYEFIADREEGSPRCLTLHALAALDLAYFLDWLTGQETGEFAASHRLAA